MSGFTRSIMRRHAGQLYRYRNAHRHRQRGVGSPRHRFKDCFETVRNARWSIGGCQWPLRWVFVSRFHEGVLIPFSGASLPKGYIRKTHGKER